MPKQLCVTLRSYSSMVRLHTTLPLSAIVTTWSLSTNIFILGMGFWHYGGQGQGWAKGRRQLFFRRWISIVLFWCWHHFVVPVVQRGNGPPLRIGWHLVKYPGAPLRKGDTEVVKKKIISQALLVWDRVSKVIVVSWKVWYTGSDCMCLVKEGFISYQGTFNGGPGGGLTIYFLCGGCDVVPVTSMS